MFSQLGIELVDLGFGMEPNWLRPVPQNLLPGNQTGHRESRRGPDPVMPLRASSNRLLLLTSTVHYRKLTRKRPNFNVTTSFSVLNTQIDEILEIITEYGSVLVREP